MSPKRDDSVIQKPALPPMRVYADIAKVVLTLVWKKLTCRACASVLQVALT